MNNTRNNQPEIEPTVITVTTTLLVSGIPEISHYTRFLAHDWYPSEMSKIISESLTAFREKYEI